jgi:hypothetical protein
MESKEKVNPRGEKAKEKARQQDLEESQQSLDLCCPRTSSKGVSTILVDILCFQNNLLQDHKGGGTMP